jgi:hypothetical protein
MIQWHCSWQSTQWNISQDTIETPVHRCLSTAKRHLYIIHNSQVVGNNPTTGEWVKKMWSNTMEFYSDKKMDTIRGHHVKWSKPGSERQRPNVFFFSFGRQIQKINIYTKTSTIIYKLRWRTCLQQCNYSKEFREGGKGRENDRASVIL